MKRLLNFAIVLLTAVLCGCGETEVTPMDYADVQVYGMSGEATAVVDYNYESFARALINTAPEKKKEELKDELTYDFMGDLLEVGVDKDKALSNNDTVTLSLDWNDNLLKSYKIKLTGEKTKEISVEGLEEYVELDAFDPEIFNVSEDVKGVHIEVTGASPLLKLQISNDIDKNDERSGIRYHEAGEQGFGAPKYHANEEEVTIDADYYNAYDGHYILKEPSGTITLPVTSRYLTSLDELSEEGWKTLYAYLNEFYADHNSVTGTNDLIWCNNNWTRSVNFNNTEETDAINNFLFEGIYMITLKNGKNYQDHIYESNSGINRIIIPFGLTFNGKPSFSATEYFEEPAAGYITIKNPIVTPDGELLLENEETGTEAVYDRYCVKTLDAIIAEETNVKDHDTVRSDIDMNRVKSGN